MKGELPIGAAPRYANLERGLCPRLQQIFCPGLPTVLPFSALAASGNSGNSFRGQLRVERFIKPNKTQQWTLQAALSEPVVSTIDPALRISEDNGWPNVEGRVALGLGEAKPVGLATTRPFEFGLSGVVGQLRTTEPLVRQVVADVWGVGADLRWNITPCFGIAGEFYSGQGLGTYNAAILQSVNLDPITPANSTLQAIRSTGGWFETFFYWSPRLHTHVGYGIDDPRDQDLAATQKMRTACSLPIACGTSTSLFGLDWSTLGGKQSTFRAWPTITDLESKLSCNGRSRMTLHGRITPTTYGVAPIVAGNGNIAGEPA